MKAHGFRFRRLAPRQRAGRRCRMVSFSQEGDREASDRPAMVEFESVRYCGRKETVVRLDYCETHGAAVARLYGARIEASDEQQTTCELSGPSSE